MHDEKDLPALYGTATVGTKGQIVIPVEARERLKIQPGDKVVIIGPQHKPEVIGICSEAAFGALLQKLDHKLTNIREALGQHHKKKGKN